MANLDIDVEIEPALLKLNGMASRFSNFKPLMLGKLHDAVLRFFKRRFETEGVFGGGRPWVQLNENYASFKKLKARRHRILQFSGQMMDAYSKKGAPGQVVEMGPNLYSLTVDESIAPRARGHQRGVKRIGLPQRQIVPPEYPRSFIDELKIAVRGYALRGKR